MRFVVSLIVVLMFALLPARAFAQWQDHAYPELGFAVESPIALEMEDGEYGTQVIGDVPAAAVILSGNAGNVLLKGTAADFTSPRLLALSANITSGCVFIAEREGRIISNLPHQAPDRTAYGVHGRITIVDVEEEGRKHTGCFFSNGRFFKIEAIVEGGTAQEDLDLAARFVGSIRFDVGGGSQ